MNLLGILKIANKYGGNRDDKLLNISGQLILFYLFLKSNNINNEITTQLINFIGNKPLEPKEKITLIDKYFALPETFKDSLLSVYPKFGTIKGKLYPLITGDLDKLFEDYAKKIGYSINTHKEVLDIVQWAKDKELLNIGIEKFILSYYWESLKELKEKDNITSNMIADDF